MSKARVASKPRSSTVRSVVGHEATRRLVRALIVLVLARPGLASAVPSGQAAVKGGNPILPTAMTTPEGDKRDEEDEDEDEDDDDDDDDEDKSDEGEGDDSAPNGQAGAQSAAAGLEAGGELDFISRFVWRGIPLSTGPVAQPEAWASWGHLTGSAWANLLLTGENGGRVANAAEVGLYYEGRWRMLTFEPHLAKHWFADAESPNTTELGIDVKARLGMWTLVSTQYVDLQATPGAYFGTIGPEYRWRRRSWQVKASLDVAWASASYNRANWGRGAGGLDLVESSLEARYYVTDLFSVAAHGAFSTLVNTDLLSVQDQPTLATFGLVLSLNH